jgi:hypothetical protein
VIYVDRNPRILFRAASRLIREFDLGPADFGIEFIGQVAELNGVSLETIAAEEGVDDFVRLYPQVPRHEALEFLARAAILVNLPQNIDMCIPSKIFDYMRFNAWLLALSARGSAPELLLRDTSADLVEPDDLEGLVALLRTRYRQHLAGQRPSPIAAEAPHLSRRAQARHLFDMIERHHGAPGAERPHPQTATAVH